MTMEVLGLSWDNGLRYKGGPFPFCEISKPTAFAHLTLSLICAVFFLLCFFFGWIFVLMLFLGFLGFLISGVVIMIASCAK